MDVELSPHPQMESTRRLLIGLLKNLIFDLAGEAVVQPGPYATAWQHQARNAGQAYVLSESEEPMSFIWVCEALELDVEWMRKSIREDGHFSWAARLREGQGAPGLLPRIMQSASSRHPTTA